MSLRRTKRRSVGSVVRRSRSDFTVSKEWMRNVESGFEEMNSECFRNSISADLRSIGSKYDNLVLKMFNQRSHLRGDLVLLKKDAKLLRNEMKFLIVKHDNSTAFKKGYGAENHEKERVLKAEVVTKEIGQLELALADLMAKYYYMLEQTKTLKEINSLWHIRSVMKSDMSKLRNRAVSSHGSEEGASFDDKVIKKEPEEVRIENSVLTQNLRWLTKLSQEFHQELRELKSAKLALVSGRCLLEKEYGKIKELEPLPPDISNSNVDMQALSNDVRKAEVRIIDALHERIDSLDSLTDTLRLMMVKAGFVNLNSINNNEQESLNNEPVNALQTYDEQLCHFEIISGSLYERKVCDPESKIENDDDTEEVQLRYVRQEDIEDIDVRSNSPTARQRFKTIKNIDGSLSGDVSNSSSTVLKENENELNYNQPTSDNNSSCNITQHEATNSQDDAFYDAEESFMSAVTIWLRPEECVLDRSSSEETLIGDMNNNLEDDEAKICKKIERKFEKDDEQFSSESTTFLSRFRNEAPSLDKENSTLRNDVKRRLITSGGKSKSKPQFTSEIPDEDDSRDHTPMPGGAMDLDSRHDRFFMAKSFFESQERNEIPSRLDKGLDMSASESFTRSSSEEFASVEVLDLANDNTGVSIKGNEEKTTVQLLKREDRPVFYDPKGWVNIGGKIAIDIGSQSNERSSQKQGNEMKQISGSNATLPRGFKSNGTSESSKTKQPTIQRRASTTDKVDGSRSRTLPRNVKKEKPSQPRHSCIGPDSTNCSPRQSPHRSPRSDKSASPVSKRSTKRTASQVLARGKQTDLPSNTVSTYSRENTFDKVNNKKQPPRPVSRADSVVKRRQSQPETDSRAVSRSNSLRPGSRSEIPRPVSRIGSFRQGDVSVYGTLPRSPKKSQTKKKEGQEMEEVARRASRPSSQMRKHPGSLSNSINQSNVDSVKDRQTQSIGNNDEVNRKSFACASQNAADEDSADDATPRKETNETSARYGMHNTLPRAFENKVYLQHQLSLDGNEPLDEKHQNCLNKSIEMDTLPGDREYQDLDKNVNTEVLEPFEEQGTLKKKKRKIVIKMRKPKSSSKCEENNGKESKSSIGAGKKSKKGVESITEKAANFMHNALKFVSSESKVNAKNISKARSENTNNSRSENESPVKRRPSSASSTKDCERRRSFIPVPSVS